MKLNNIIISTLACLLVALFSTQINAANVWTGNKKVSSVQVVEDGGFLIGFDSEISSICTQAGTSRLYIYKDHQNVTADGLKSLLSSALSALASGMTVSVMYDDSDPACWGKYIFITNE